MKDKRNVIIIAAILAVVASLMFLLVTVTPDFIVAYIFALIGIAGLLICTLVMISKKENFAWVSALPHQALIYLIIQLVFSIVFVVLEQLAVYTLPVAWFIVIHAVILAIFAIRLIMLWGSVKHIEARDEQVQQKVSFVQSSQVEVELLAAQTADSSLQDQLKSLAEKIRYSDPMSAPALAPIEAQITEKLQALKASLNQAEVAQTILSDIHQLLDERNKKCKLNK